MAFTKVVKGFEEAVADIPDGAVLMIAGAMGPLGIPQNLIKAVARKGVKSLTVIVVSPGIGAKTAPAVGYPEWYVDQGILIENKQVKKLISGAPFLGFGQLKFPAHDPYFAGELEVEHIPHGIMAVRMWAAGAGVGGVYVPTGVGTHIEEGKEKKVIEGKEYILELPLRSDFAFIAAHKGDEYGNLVYWGTGRQYNPVMARAARVTIAEVGEIVKPGELDPEVIVTPGIYVDRIVEIPKEGKK